MKVQLSILILTTIISSCVNASSGSVVWKERGNRVSASTVNEHTSVYTRNIKSVSKNKKSKTSPKLKLSTGQSVTLTGGVYVNSQKPDTILEWASQRGYQAKKDKYMHSVVHIETSPTESISVANELSEFSGVETASPNYRLPKVLK